MRWLKLVSGFLCFCLVATCFSACSISSIPPGKEKMERRLADSYEDFKLVTEYLLSLPCEDAYIYEDRPGEFLGDLTWYTIEDSQVKDAVQRLLKNGTQEIAKDKERNAVQFTMWTSFHEIDCGILYAIEESRIPTAQFMTQLEPMEQASWYYYVADYNLWRSTGRKEWTNP